MMEEPTERIIGKVIKYGVALAEVSVPKWKPAEIIDTP